MVQTCDTIIKYYLLLLTSILVLPDRRSVHTVNSEIFARTLFSRDFAYAKFRENKILAKGPNDSVIY